MLNIQYSKEKRECRKLSTLRKTEWEMNGRIKIHHEMIYCFLGQSFNHSKAEPVIFPELQLFILEIQMPMVNLIFLF